MSGSSRLGARHAEASSPGSCKVQHFLFGSSALGPWPPLPAQASWVVEHRAVLIRSQPSVKALGKRRRGALAGRRGSVGPQAEKLGIVCKGHVLKGYEMEGPGTSEV